MSDRLSKLSAGLVVGLLIAGSALACPGAAKDKSANSGQETSAQVTASQSGRS
jgi:hypothetical protein